METMMETGTRTPVDDFRRAGGPVLDVRSPSEFAQGHIPDAQSFPLFTDDERAEIGICYKHKGRDAAILLGFDFVGPRLGEMIRTATGLAPEKKVRIHCWRGGMRSGSVAWLLGSAGFDVTLLDGGYKSYRQKIRQILSTRRRINILGGLTGTGKTNILNVLPERGEQALDLEGLANHRGSSFGGLGMPPQPTTQHFENLIAEELDLLDPSKTIWIESESRQVGSCTVPEELFRQMKSAPVIEIVRPLEDRLDILTEMYGQIDTRSLVEATQRISRGLGGERTTAAVELIEKGCLREAVGIILDYYDRSYRSDLKRRPAVPPKLEINGIDDASAADLLVTTATSLMSADTLDTKADVA
jgi:tRNA 2-selenouridine synthase